VTVSFMGIGPCRGLLATAAIALLLGGCAAGEAARREGLSLLTDGQYEAGLARLADSARENRESARIRKDYLFQRDMIINRLLQEAGEHRAAGRLEPAEAAYRRVLGIDPAQPAAKKGLADLEMEQRHGRLLAEAETLARKNDRAGARALVNIVAMENPASTRAGRLRVQLEEPTLKESVAGPRLNLRNGKPVTLQFRDANLKMVLEAISRTTGVNIILDKDVKNDIKVTLFVRDTTVEEAIDLILLQSQLEKRVLGDNSVLIYPFTAAKTKDYQDMKVRRFGLANAEAKKVQEMLKTILKVKDVFVDDKTNAVIIRDTPEAIRVAEQLVAGMDRPEPEVMLEIDVMQVDRTRALALGFDWTRSFTWSLRDKMTLQDFKNRTIADVNLSNLSLTANASKTDGDINDLATPRIRVRNKEKAKILIGTRNPVVSSAATPAPTGGGQTVFNTSIQYIETGIKVEVEPQIHPDGDVAIKLALEVSQAGAQIDTGDKGTVVFPVNTNNVNTLLQLKDGETQILGGLIQHQMDQSQASLPGVGDLPLVGRLFGTVRDTWNKRELVLAITPRVLRNVPVQESDLIELWSGTEAKVRFGAPALSSGVTGGGVTQAQGGAPSEATAEATAAPAAAPSLPPAPPAAAKGTP